MVCNFLVFSGNVVGSSGILINAQNMEIGSFYSIRFDPVCTIGNGEVCPCQTYVDGGTCPVGCLNNTCDSVHRHHIWHKAGRVEIYGMVSTRSDPRNFAIEAWDMIGVHGWNSEDRRLVHANFIPFAGPSVVTGVHQRGWLSQPTETVINWEDNSGNPFALRDSIINGDVELHAGGTGYGCNSLSNNRFEAGGQIIGHGPVSFNALDSTTGTLSFVSPTASIELGPPSGEEHLSIKHGGIQLGGMMNLSHGADLRKEHSNATVLPMRRDGNLFRVAGNTTITSIQTVENVQSVILFFADQVIIKDDVGNLRLAGDLNATPGSTLQLVGLGKEWLELSRSVN